jgi:hypothetical protein
MTVLFPIKILADCDVIRCYGGAKPTDTHPFATAHCMDEDIHRVVEAP